LVLRPYVRGDGRPQAFDAPWSWWYDAARGGGILGAVGSHLIDLCRFWTGSEVVEVSGRTATFVSERSDERRVRHAVTADEYASFVMRLASGAVATITLTTVGAHGPGHFAQVTGRDGTLVLTGETTLEVGRSGGPLEDASVPDDLWEQTVPNNMWARSFVRLMRVLVRSGPRRRIRLRNPHQVPRAAGVPGRRNHPQSARQQEAAEHGGRVPAPAGRR